MHLGHSKALIFLRRTPVAVALCVFSHSLVHYRGNSSSLLAYPFLLVAIAVAFLRESLVAVLALEWSETSVHVDVVHHVTELGECVPAGCAHEKLIRAAGVLVLGEQLDKA